MSSNKSKIMTKHILPFYIFTALSCHTGVNKQWTRPFFSYDEVEYYSTDFPEDDIIQLDSLRERSTIDGLRASVLLDGRPSSTDDSTAIQSLEKLGFKKRILSNSFKSELDKIFSEKMVGEIVAPACIHVYRDILVFKNKSKTTGVAKICFSCMDAQFTGTESNTESFGQSGEYDQLQRLLGK